jgi:hypothetical protein
MPQLQKDGKDMIIHRIAFRNGSMMVTNLNKLRRHRGLLTTLLQIAEASGLRVWRAPGAKFAFGEFQQLGLVFSCYIGTPFHLLWHKQNADINHVAWLYLGTLFQQILDSDGCPINDDLAQSTVTMDGQVYLFGGRDIDCSK